MMPYENNVYDKLWLRIIARRRAATRKMKQMKNHNSKETDDVDNEDENEDVCSEMGECYFRL